MTDWDALLRHAPSSAELRFAEEVGLPDHLALYKPGDLGSNIEPPSEAIFTGRVGDLLALIAPETEASVAGLGLSLITGLSAWMGRRVKFVNGGFSLRPHLFGAIVGPTAYGRKGTAINNGVRFLEDLDRGWALDGGVRRGAFGSGEALIQHISDPVFNEEGELVSGSMDQRLFNIEGEFARLLRIINRQGSTMGDTIRDVYDGNRLENTTKRSSNVSTGHTVAVAAGITPEELARQLSEIDALGGLGNRFIWCWSVRSKLLPFGGKPISFADIVEGFEKAKKTWRVEVGFSDDALDWWVEHYEWLSDLRGVPRSLHPMVSRSSDHVLKIATIYAAGDADTTPHVEVRHLEAGLAWMRHSWQTIESVVGGAVAGSVASRVLARLRSHPMVPVEQRDLQRSLHITAAEIVGAAVELGKAGFAFEYLSKKSPASRVPVKMLIATMPDPF